MKISICGKGGSGKSTIVTLLANELEARGYRVLVVDSDESNTGLFRMLGFDDSPIPLMELVGGKIALKAKMASMHVLPQTEIGLKDIPPGHVIERNNLSLVNIGKILQSYEGCACPMGVLTWEFLKKLCLDTNEFAIVDTEAGVEHFGRGIEANVDCVLVTVEPSLECLELASRVKNMAASVTVDKIFAVLNKVESDEIALRLKEELNRRGMDVHGTIHYDPGIFEACLEGHSLGGGKAAEDIKQVADSLMSRV
jgi:CO dehydrogenase maturation factor